MATDDAPAAPAAPQPVANTSSESADATNNGNRGRDNRSRRGRGGGNGNRGGKRGGGRQNDKKRSSSPGSGAGNKKRDIPSQRDQVQNNRAAKRQKVINEKVDGNSYMSISFTPEEIAADQRRPKRKVAVMIGYAGTGYHGIQINHKDKTIEGDLFAAFVAAGAISKANADDPKKSQLVRCARTDKGVHAAANVLSMKLIIEDEDIVDKINARLPDQIRVWGIQRVNGGFNCYQGCESRWYEYLMPSYALLPPHPNSFLGKKIESSATEKGIYHEYLERQGELKNFWEEVEKNDIQPILAKMDPELRAEVLRIVRDAADQDLDESEEAPKQPEAKTEESGAQITDAPAQPTAEETADTSAQATADSKPEATQESGNTDTVMADAETTVSADATAAPAKEEEAEKELTPVEKAVREVKAAYVAAKRRYRVTPDRIEKLQEALNLYLGTHNFHNYTVLKRFSDPSAKRHIKSFDVNKTPIPIRDTEWLSLKVHGQSFMMHQIRKMVAMAVMTVRSGAPLDLIKESYGNRRISIPKAPGLGLLLERPMFTQANIKLKNLGLEEVDFAKYDDKIQAFKDEHIYRRMFELEEKENSFHMFFNQVDNFRTDYFLWVTAGGLEASKERSDRTAEKVPRALQAELGDEADGVVEDGS